MNIKRLLLLIGASAPGLFTSPDEILNRRAELRQTGVPEGRIKELLRIEANEFNVSLHDLATVPRRLEDTLMGEDTRMSDAKLLLNLFPLYYPEKQISDITPKKMITIFLNNFLNDLNTDINWARHCGDIQRAIERGDYPKTPGIYGLKYFIRLFETSVCLFTLARDTITFGQELIDTTIFEQQLIKGCRIMKEELRDIVT